MQRSIYASPRPRRNVDLHITLSEQASEVLDRIRHRMARDGKPRHHNEVIEMGIFLLESVQAGQRWHAEHSPQIPRHPDLITGEEGR